MRDDFIERLRIRQMPDGWKKKERSCNYRTGKFGDGDDKFIRKSDPIGVILLEGRANFSFWQLKKIFPEYDLLYPKS